MNRPDGTPALELIDIGKRFGTTAALDGAHLVLRPGTVHGLLGENGAGKTTLMRIAFGMLQPDRGQLRIGGRAVRLRSPRDAIALGVGMVHQHFTHVPAMTVAENVALGGRGRFAPGEAERRVLELGHETGLHLDPRARVATLGVGAQQRLEILKALARRARLLILDEPTAVLAPAEAEELLRWLRQFAVPPRAVVLITHKLREAVAIADTVTVLRRGRTVLSAAAREVTTDDLAAAMLGDAPPHAPAQSAVSPGAVVVRLEDATIADEHGREAVRGATLEVRGGELLGIAGVENSGHHALLRALAGRLDATKGRMERHGTAAFIPEDRQRDALVLGYSLAENIALKNAGMRRGLVPWAAIRTVTERLVQEHDVRPSDVDLPAGALSGGNQQKLVFARELSDEPALIVAENPTRGLDIRATAAVHQRLLAAAASGVAVVVYSTDLDEVLSLATRMVVVHAARVREVPRDRESVGHALLGLP